MRKQLPGRPDGKEPLIYMGTVPNMVIMPRRPTVADCGPYELGYWWIIPKTNDGSIPEKEIWILVGKQQGIATWKRLHGGGGPTLDVLVNYQYFTTPGVHTYTPTPGMKQCFVECVGGGGGSYPGDNTPAAPFGVGGGGGGYSAKLYTSDEIGVSQSCFVGSGGVGVGPSSPPGNHGEDTTFGAGSILITASGGKSAEVLQIVSGVYFYNSSGGSGVGGDINISGGSGEFARESVDILMARGGSSVYGQGSIGLFDQTVAFGYRPQNGGLYGGGASPSFVGASVVANGANGLIKVTEYLI